MRARWKHVIAAAVTLSFAGCSDATSPETQALIDLVLDFCGSEIPTFFAFQNDGGAFTKVTADASGSFSFKAGNKVVLAFVQQFGADFSTNVFYTTKTDLQPISGVACIEGSGTKTLNGTVAGLTAGQAASVTMGTSSVFVVSPQTTFQITKVPTVAVDLVAQREVFGSSSVTPNRMIVRRALNLTSTIPVLDFSAAEAVAPASNTATVGGLVSGETNTLLVAFGTTTGTSHLLSVTQGFSGGLQTIFGIPSTLTAAGDFHHLTLEADVSNATSGRIVTTWYRNPADKTLTLGSTLNAPSVTTTATTPYVRLHATLAKQDEYNTLVSFLFTQASGTVSRDWSLTATAGYFGGTAPAIWDLTMPDLSAVAGFPAGGIQTGQSYTVDAEASNARPALFFGPESTSPTDGETAKFAFRTITIATSQASVAERRARREMRSPFSRMRMGLDR
jgi:hypothetical protein